MQSRNKHLQLKCYMINNYFYNNIYAVVFRKEDKVCCAFLVPGLERKIEAENWLAGWLCCTKYYPTLAGIWGWIFFSRLLLHSIIFFIIHNKTKKNFFAQKN